MPQANSCQDRDIQASNYPSLKNDRRYRSARIITLVACSFELRKLNALHVRSREQAGNEGVRDAKEDRLDDESKDEM